MVRQRVVLTRDEVHRLLGLPDDVAIVGMDGLIDGTTPAPSLVVVFEGSRVPQGWKLPFGTVKSA